MSTPFPRIAHRLLLLIATLLLLSGCATGFPMGGYPSGGGYGGYGGYPDRGATGREVSGTVQDFDPSSGRLTLETGGYGTYGGRVDLWLDRSTRAYYGGREVDPAGLERGDGVRVAVEDDGRRVWARSIEVVRNVRDGGSPYGGYGQPYGGTGFEGAVRRVDLGQRVIEVTRGGYSGSIERVWFDERTRFEHQGRLLRPEQLEGGDIVRIEGRPAQGGLYAETVSVTVDARSR